jgi:replicative DNA helicase
MAEHGRAEQGRNGSDGGRRQGPRAAAVDVGRLFDLQPPHSPEAEMSLLGSMILDPQVIGEVLPIVPRASDFYSARHGAIYSAIIAVYEQHQDGDLVQIVDSLRSAGQLEDSGGPEYLVQLAEQVPSAVNAPYYARIVAEKSRLRRLIDSAGQILYDAFHSESDGAGEVLDRAESLIFEIAEDDQRSDPQRLEDLLQAELERLETADGLVPGVPTGFDDLDEILSGLQAGEMLIIAARPSMGKTALALNLAEQIAMGGKTPWTPAKTAHTPVGFFSLEMSKAAVAQRLLSAYSGLDSHKLRTGGLSDPEFAEVMARAGELSEAPIFVDDTPGMTILTLRARARRMVAQHHVKAIMIDYLQLLTAPNASRESRQVEVSAISRGVKALARELNVPVICLSQLNRGAEQREGHRPRMSDLRESGSIEQDADVIMLLHREAYYHRGDPEWDPDSPEFDEENRDKLNTAELIVAKQRNGPTGVVKLVWDDSTTRFKTYSARSDFVDYSAPAPAVGAPHTAGATTAEAKPQRHTFAPGSHSGPVSDFRDGGGPDDADDDLPPF